MRMFACKYQARGESDVCAMTMVVWCGDTVVMWWYMHCIHNLILLHSYKLLQIFALCITASRHVVYAIRHAAKDRKSQIDKNAEANYYSGLKLIISE